MYLIATYPEDEVIYIGKATPGSRSNTSNYTVNHHLAGEMFSHVGRPPSKAAPGVLFHKGLLMEKTRMNEAAKKKVTAGALRIALITIQPWQCASYVETYLQAVAQLLDGALPFANDRIG